MKNNRMQLPKNIRQIGETDKYHKIYIEDYVITYLRQIAISEEMGSKAVALFGSMERDGEYSYYFIYGAVCSEKNRLEEGKSLFDKEDKEYILEKKKEFFKEDEIVGWVLLENEFNRITDDGIWKNGKDEFSNENKLFLRSDVNTNNESFKMYSNGMQKTIPGYAIFYDKNEAMQAYLVEWHKQRADTSIEEVGDGAARQFRSIIMEKHENNYQQKAMSIFYIASTMLMIVLCVTGISMLNHYQKMKDMETAISHLVQAMDESGDRSSLPAMESDVGIQVDAAVTVSANAENNEAEQNAVEVDTVTEDTKVEEQVTAIEQVETEIQPEKQTEPTIYIVESGDTLVDISRSYYKTSKKVDEICIFNNIENSNSIMVGQKILLP